MQILYTQQNTIYSTQIGNNVPTILTKGLLPALNKINKYVIQLVVALGWSAIMCVCVCV